MEKILPEIIAEFCSGQHVCDQIIILVEYFLVANQNASKQFVDPCNRISM